MLYSGRSCKNSASYTHVSDNHALNSGIAVAYILQILVNHTYMGCYELSTILTKCWLCYVYIQLRLHDQAML